MERFHRTIKHDCIRQKMPLSVEDARRVVGEFVLHYNTVRLYSAIGYVTPQDLLSGLAPENFAERDRKLAAARERRAAKRRTKRTAT